MDAGAQSTAAMSGNGVAPSAASQLAQSPVESGAAGPLRVLLAERRASAHSDLSRRLASLGHEVLARVTSTQGAVDYAGFLCPDVVLVSPVLEDGIGITAAMSVTRGRPGVAAVVLTNHPAAASPAARPNWGAVALLPADADAADLDAELRRVVGMAREAVSQAGRQGTRPSVSPAPVAAVDPEILAAQDATELASPVIVPALDAGYDDAVNELVDDVFDPPARDGEPTVPDAPIDRGGSDETMAFAATTDGVGLEPKRGEDVVERAVQSLVERSRLLRADAIRLMEQEAEDTDQSVVDVARAMLGEDVGATVSGEVASV
jgi:DNA-binding NarL/FixJ family response regulator